MNTLKLKDELLALGGVLIGSTALGVATKESDIDIAISLSNIPKELLTIGSNLSLKNYTNVNPLGNNKLVVTNSDTSHKMDILIYEKQSSVDTLKEVMEIMSNVPKILLSSKRLRVNMFSYLLVSKGWEHTVDPFGKFD